MLSRFLKPALAVVLTAILGVYIGLPLAMAVAAVWPTDDVVGAPPAGFRPVSIEVVSDVSLGAWYRPSSNGASVILVHGAGGSREGMRSLSSSLSGQGYGVLALDLEGHGTSGGTTNRLGWTGTSDIVAAVRFLRSREPAVRIGAVGSSLGGEVLLGSSAECAELRAIVADGATRRCTSELLTLPSERQLARNFTARVMYAGVRAFSGQQPPAPMLGEMKRSPTTTRFLFIAAGDESLEVAFNRLFATALGERATLWVAPGVAHVRARAKYPLEYERRVLDFLEAWLAPV